MNKNRKVYELAEKWAKENLEKIEVFGVGYDGGQRCHHVARNNIDSGVLVVTLMFIPRSGVRIHMINKTEKYIDNTLGYLTEYNTHYKLSEFTLEELKDYDHPVGMSNLLMEFKLNVLGVLGLNEDYLANI